MQNIEIVKNKYLIFFAQKYFKESDTTKLSEQDLYRCKALAEVWAYIDIVIPDGYGKYSIFDFDGRAIDEKTKQRKTILMPSVVSNVKNVICQYCWGIDWPEVRGSCNDDEKEMIMFLRKRSILKSRWRKGNNIVIFGGVDEPAGRSMLASTSRKLSSIPAGLKPPFSSLRPPRITGSVIGPSILNPAENLPIASATRSVTLVMSSSGPGGIYISR